MFNCYLNSSYCIPLFPGCFSMGYLEKVKLRFEQLAAINELILGQLSMLNWLSNLKRSVSKNKYSTASLVPRWKKGHHCLWGKWWHIEDWNDSLLLESVTCRGFISTSPCSNTRTSSPFGRRDHSRDQCDNS